MGFDRGSISFRLFYLSSSLGPSVVERFAEHAAPPIESLSTEPIQGWVTGRHLLDTRLTEESCVMGGYLHANLMRAERKIPEALLRAHCRLEEEIQMRARQTENLPRAARTEIRDELMAQLRSKMPPTLTGIPVAIDFRNDRVFAGALSDAQIERFAPAFRQATGIMPVELNSETAALKRKQVNMRDIHPESFSPDPLVAPDENVHLGMDFLTWLWWRWETEGGTFHREKGGAAYGMMLEGPLTFFREGKGAHETLLRKGSPLDSREAGIALLSGKRLKRTKFVLAQGDALWSVTLDADFAFRGVRLPKGEQIDASGRFQERMLHIETLVETVLSFYDRFLEQRASAGEWKKVIASMRAWVAKRAGV